MKLKLLVAAGLIAIFSLFMVPANATVLDTSGLTDIQRAQLELDIARKSERNKNPLSGVKVEDAQKYAMIGTEIGKATAIDGKRARRHRQ